MDKKSDPGNDQQHHQRELIEIESEICLEVSGANPSGHGLHVRRRQGREPDRDPKRHGESGAAERECHCCNGSRGKPAAKETVDGGADQRQQRNQPEMQVRGHSLSRFTRSTSKVSRVRYTAMMMASPTAASAAATTITKKTKTCPLSACQCAAKATNDKLTPLSINSMDMKMVMIFRLIRNPVTPQANKMPLSTR